jgi:hypothetical protein
MRLKFGNRPQKSGRGAVTLCRRPPCAQPSDFSEGRAPCYRAADNSDADNKIAALCN